MNTNEHVSTHNSFLDKIKRLIISVLWQVPWFGSVWIVIWYVQKNLVTYLTVAFELSAHINNAHLLSERTNLLKKGLSLTNPMGYADYIGAVSADIFAQAKVSTIQQTIRLLSGFFDGVLDIVWMIACVYAFFRVLRTYKSKTQENDIANAVVSKLLPILTEIKSDRQVSHQQNME